MSELYFLNDEEKELVKAFVENNKQCEAVRKVLLKGLYENGVLVEGKRAEPAINFALALVFNNTGGEVSNEQLGQDLRSSAMGMRLLETAFKDMIALALPKPAKPAEGNQAR